MRHDLAWCRCYSDIEKRGDRKAHPLMLSTRFLALPSPLYRRMFDREFRECIRTADSNMLDEVSGCGFYC